LSIQVGVDHDTALCGSNLDSIEPESLLDYLFRKEPFEEEEISTLVGFLWATAKGYNESPCILSPASSSPKIVNFARKFSTWETSWVPPQAPGRRQSNRMAAKFSRVGDKLRPFPTPRCTPDDPTGYEACTPTSARKELQSRKQKALPGVKLIQDPAAELESGMEEDKGLRAKTVDEMGKKTVNQLISQLDEKPVTKPVDETEKSKRFNYETEYQSSSSSGSSSSDSDSDSDSSETSSDSSVSTAIGSKRKKRSKKQKKRKQKKRRKEKKQKRERKRKKKERRKIEAREARERLQEEREEQLRIEDRQAAIDQRADTDQWQRERDKIDDKRSADLATTMRAQLSGQIALQDLTMKLMEIKSKLEESREREKSATKSMTDLELMVMKLSFAPVSAITAIPPINAKDLVFTEIHKKLVMRTGADTIRNQLQAHTKDWECQIDLGSVGQFLSTDGFSPPTKDSFGGFTVFMFNPTPNTPSEEEMAVRLESLV
jgi:hypothetical protein